MPSWLSFKMNANTWALLALGSLLLFGGSLVYSWSKDKRIDELEGKEKEYETRAEMFVQMSRKHEENAYQYAIKNQALMLQVEALKNQIKPIPPKPGPAPVEDEKLRTDLKMFGLKREVQLFNADEYNQLHFGDAQLIWTWASEAQRVPGLEDEIVKRDAVIEKQSQLVKGLEAQNVETNLALDSTKKAFAEKQAQVETVESILNETKKKQRATEVRWWLKVGFAAVAGYCINDMLN